MLRVKYNDNDFGTHFFKACEEFLSWHARKEPYPEAKKRYKKLLKEVPIEEIRRGIITGAWAAYIMERAIRSHIQHVAWVSKYGPRCTGFGVKDLLGIDEQKYYLDYFNKNTTVKEVEYFDSDDSWNGESCYIDFFTYEVHRR